MTVGDRLQIANKIELNAVSTPDFSSLQEPQVKYCSANQDDFTSIYGRLYPFAYSFAKRFVSHDDAIDLVSSVFIKFWERKKVFTGFLSVKMYLKASIRNACLNFLEHNRFKEDQLKELGRLTDQSEYLDDTLGELMKKIALEIEKLPAQSRRIFKMAWIDGAKNKDIAEQLGLSVNTVRAQKQNALRFLRLNIKAEDALLLFLLISKIIE